MTARCHEIPSLGGAARAVLAKPRRAGDEHVFDLVDEVGQVLAARARQVVRVRMRRAAAAGARAVLDFKQVFDAQGRIRGDGLGAVGDHRGVPASDRRVEQPERSSDGRRASSRVALHDGGSVALRWRARAEVSNGARSGARGARVRETRTVVRDGRGVERWRAGVQAGRECAGPAGAAKVRARGCLLDASSDLGGAAAARGLK